MLLAAGCGGSGTKSAGSSTISSQAFVASANAICSQANARAAAVFESPKPPDLANFEHRLNGTIDSATLSAQQRLTPPASDQADWSRYLASGQQGLALDRRYRLYDLQHPGQARPARLVAAGKAHDVQDQQLAKRLGLHACETAAPAGGSYVGHRSNGISVSLRVIGGAEPRVKFTVRLPRTTNCTPRGDHLAGGTLTNTGTLNRFDLHSSAFAAGLSPSTGRSTFNGAPVKASFDIRIAGIVSARFARGGFSGRETQMDSAGRTILDCYWSRGTTWTAIRR